MSAAAAVEKMRARGMPEAAVATFAHHLRSLEAGETGLLPDADLEPLDDVPSLEEVDGPPDAEALDRTVVIKLNGGLGTTMGLTGAKSLVEARDGLSFLDVIARQVLHLRRAHGARLPLVLMDSEHTRDDALAALARHDGLAADVPGDFLQHVEPRLLAEDLAPVEWPARPELEWCPPGHGDLYVALATSGMLGALLDAGYRHAFVSNADNLGAVLHPGLLTWFAASGAPFAMEVVLGTEADRKGGHLARHADGRTVLRETAMVPPGDAASFRDFRRWRFYNTNNLYLDLRALAARLDAGDGVLPLPLIVNHKTVDPRDPSTPEVLQLETAMGAAVGVFDGAQAVCVPRSRFIPVKTTDDLLVLRSDVYAMGEDGVLAPQAAVPFVELDPDHYKRLDDFEARFPHGPPSLAGAERFVVRGDVTFGAGTLVRGAAHVCLTPERDRTGSPGTPGG